MMIESLLDKFGRMQFEYQQTAEIFMKNDQFVNYLVECDANDVEQAV